MADLRKLKDRAAELVEKGRLEKAVDVYREVLAADPKDVATRQKLADALRRTGRDAEAIATYTLVAERYAEDGLLIKAIAICKSILELDPAHAATQAALADLYGARAGAEPPRRTILAMPAVVPAPAEVSLPPPAPAPAPTGFTRILDAAGAAGAAGVEAGVILELDPMDEVLELELLPEPEAAPVPLPAPAPTAAGPALPRVPIFSDLSRDAFLALTGSMVLHRVAAGTTLLHEGDAGEAFYVVASGALAVSKRNERGEATRLARLGEGDFFGEMALLSGAPRAATVAALEDSEVLEFPPAALLALAGQHPHVAGSLKRFYRQRLLANALAVSPVFRPFARADKKRVMARFRAREVAVGEEILREGAPSDGLYVVLDGRVDVYTRRTGEPVLVAQLEAGDLFGEMSCLRKAPATANVVVSRAGTLLRLPRAEFDDLVSGYPQILELVAELTDERRENLDAILSGAAEWTEEGLVLV